jgi:hypothetical protein
MDTGTYVEMVLKMFRLLRLDFEIEKNEKWLFFMEGPASDLQLTYLRDLWGLTLSFSMAF